MIKTKLEWTIWMVTIALLGSGWIFVSRSPKTESRTISLTEAPIVGHFAPSFTLQTPGGETIALSEKLAEGQPVVLNFWASWCGPCRVEMPFFQNASLKYKNRVAIIGINQGESEETVVDFGQQFNITYPLLYDPDDQVNQSYLVKSLPTTVFISSDGIVQEIVIGSMSQAVLEERIERLVNSR